MGNEDNGKLTENGKKSRFSPIFFEVAGKMGNFQRGIHWFASTIMTLLTLVILVGVLAYSVKLPGLFKAIFAGEDGSLIELIEFVAEVIIGLELVYVIIAQNLESVIEILMIAFTRELVIRDWEMWEILVGVAVVAGLFAIRKYLLDKKE